MRAKAGDRQDGAVIGLVYKDKGLWVNTNNMERLNAKLLSSKPSKKLTAANLFLAHGSSQH